MGLTEATDIFQDAWEFVVIDFDAVIQNDVQALGCQWVEGNAIACPFLFPYFNRCLHQVRSSRITDNLNLIRRVVGIVATITDSQLKIPPAFLSFSTRWFLPACVFEFFLQIWYIGDMEDVLEKRIGTPDFLTGKKGMKMKLKMRNKGIPYRFFYSSNFDGIRAQPGE